MKKVIGGAGFLIAGSTLFNYIMSHVDLYIKDSFPALLLSGPIPPVIFGVGLVMMIVGSMMIIRGIKEN